MNRTDVIICIITNIASVLRLNLSNPSDGIGVKYSLSKEYKSFSLSKTYNFDRENLFPSRNKGKRHQVEHDIK